MDVEELLGAPELLGTRWSVEIRDVAGGPPLHSHHPDRLLRSASVAKVFLLVEVAARLEEGSLRSEQPVRRDSVTPVADSGLWQHLALDSLPLADVALLVGSVSDNWATNALLGLVGLPAVQQRARSLAPGGSTLHDAVRDRRAPGDPPTLSEGCARDWAGIFVGLAGDTVVDPAVSRQVLAWLRPGVDLSMVASALVLDPLAHAEPDRGVSLWNKTGTDGAARADVGLVRGPDGAVAYAALCTWDRGDDDPRDAVMSTMRDLGTLVAGHVRAR